MKAEVFSYFSHFFCELKTFLTNSHLSQGSEKKARFVQIIFSTFFDALRKCLKLFYSFRQAPHQGTLKSVELSRMKLGVSLLC